MHVQCIHKRIYTCTNVCGGLHIHVQGTRGYSHLRQGLIIKGLSSIQVPQYVSIYVHFSYVYIDLCFLCMIIIMMFCMYMATSTDHVECCR